jgi:hypothetical protein
MGSEEIRGMKWKEPEQAKKAFSAEMTYELDLKY